MTIAPNLLVLIVHIIVIWPHFGRIIDGTEGALGVSVVRVIARFTRNADAKRIQSRQSNHEVHPRKTLMLNMPPNSREIVEK